MSRVLLSVIALTLAVALLAGCAAGAPPEYTDDKVPITASVGKPFVIALASNPTTGFSWQLNYDTMILTLTNKDYVQDPGAAGRVGAGGTEKFTFQGVKTGTTKVTLTYQRPWESVPPTETKTFSVTIR
ncbi:MAG: protease inhibitor I42 family protein [Chloroflexota bacterium]